MQKKLLQLKPQKISAQILSRLEKAGLVMTFKPTPAALAPPYGENIAEPLYVSDPKFGPHKLIAVGFNKSQVRLGVHSDHEEFLIPVHNKKVKPIFLMVCQLAEDEIHKKDEAGDLVETDFTCLSLYPAPRGAEMFTMCKGAVHCEATTPGAGEIGCFFVTESDYLDIRWIDLQNTEISVKSDLSWVG